MSALKEAKVRYLSAKMLLQAAFENEYHPGMLICYRRSARVGWTRLLVLSVGDNCMLRVKNTTNTSRPYTLSALTADIRKVTQ